MNPSRRQITIKTIKDRLDARDDPFLRKNVERHEKNVERLAGSLRALGLHEDKVDASVLEASEAYEELLREYVAAKRGREHS
jgi:hypothetical protein